MCPNFTSSFQEMTTKQQAAAWKAEKCSHVRLLKCHCAANSTRQYRPTAHSARCSPGYCMQCGVVSVKIHYTRILSPRIGLQRLQRHHSKMAVSRHLGFYRTANSAIRSADPENPSLEPNMEWIGCTVCEIFAFKLHCDLETGVRGHSKWHYSIQHIRLYIRLPQ